MIYFAYNDKEGQIEKINRKNSCLNHYFFIIAQHRRILIPKDEQAIIHVRVSGSMFPLDFI